MIEKANRILTDIENFQKEDWDRDRIVFALMIENMRWSFSRINGFNTCPYCWFNTYILKEKSGSNVFAEFGLIGHEILEDFLNEKIFYWDLADRFEEEFIKLDKFPPNKYVDLRETYYKGGNDYFTNFDGFPDLTPLEVELQINTRVFDYEFIGYIDYLARDKKDGKIIVIDHKSKGGFKSKRERAEYARQLYLYCKGVYEKYGEYPKELRFNMFRKGDTIKIPFKMEDYLEAQQWAFDTIQTIKQKDIFKVTDDDFFGNWLCNHRHKEEHKKGFELTLKEGLSRLEK